jgi:hypothetical protein
MYDPTPTAGGEERVNEEVCARCGKKIERIGDYWYSDNGMLPYCRKKASLGDLAELHAPRVAADV